MNGARCALKKLLVLDIRFKRRKELVPATHLRQSGAKTHLNVDDRHTGLPCGRKHTRSALQELFRGLDIDRYDAGLAIHGENRGARDFESEIGFHSARLK